MVELELSGQSLGEKLGRVGGCCCVYAEPCCLRMRMSVSMSMSMSVSVRMSSKCSKCECEKMCSCLCLGFGLERAAKQAVWEDN